MRLEFDITLTAKDMFRFNLYQTYTGASGWISVIAAVVCFAAAGTKYSERGASYTVLGILLGALILLHAGDTLSSFETAHCGVRGIEKQPALLCGRRRDFRDTGGCRCKTDVGSGL